MAIVAVAILISFHLKQEPSPLELRVALPFGIIFWLLAIACLVSGLANYIKTVERYSKREALVQSGWKTQVVSLVPSFVTIDVTAGLKLGVGVESAKGRSGKRHLADSRLVLRFLLLLRVRLSLLVCSFFRPMLLPDDGHLDSSGRYW